MTQATTHEAEGSVEEPVLRENPKRLGQLLFGGLFFLIFLGYTMMAFAMPSGSLEQPGPGMFPRAVGVAGLIVSVVVILEVIMKRSESGDINLPKGDDLKVTIVYAATILGYVLVLPVLGMMASSILYAISFLKFGSATSWPRSIVVGGLLGGVLTLFFSTILGLPLPRGMVF